MASVQVINPFDQSVAGTVPRAEISDCVAAVGAAEDAFPSWRGTAPRARAEILRRAYELMIAEHDELSRTIPHLVESWIRTNQQLMVALSNQTLMTRMIRFTFGLVVAIGVASVLMVAVVQKTREIGILRAMGTSRGRVLRVFLVQGAIIGLIGAVLGCAIGYALAQFMSGILTSADGSRLFSAHLDFPLYAYTTIGAVVLGVISAALPARRAARLDPAQAIRM